LNIDSKIDDIMKVIKLTESDLTNIVKRVIKESNTKNYSKSILGVLEGFEDDYVCGFDVDYQENYDTYLIKIIVGNRDLDNDFKVSVSQRHYLNKLKKDVTEYLISYLPIKFLVDFKRTANCSDYKKYKQMTESDETNIVKRVIKENEDNDFMFYMEELGELNNKIGWDGLDIEGEEMEYFVDEIYQIVHNAKNNSNLSKDEISKIEGFAMDIVSRLD
jgi:hypothetical protein